MDLSITKHLDEPARTNETADVLRRAKALIGTPEKWCKFSLSSGSARCSAQALAEADGFPDGSDLRRYASPARKILERVMVGSICEFNNTRTHADVMAAFDRAIEMAERQGL